MKTPRNVLQESLRRDSQKLQRRGSRNWGCRGIVLSAALFVALIFPVTAVAEDVATEDVAAGATAPKNAPEQVLRDLRYMASDVAPQPEETITIEDGTPYRLTSVSEPILDPSYAVPTRNYTQQVTKKIPLEGIDVLSEYFSAKLSIKDGAYVGSIGLSSNPYQIETVYESWSGQVDRQYEIENLPDNDVARLPVTMDFEVSSDAAPDATQTKRLALLDVRYEVKGTNSLGLPNNYKAYLTYRGEESWLELHHYIVTATYQGTVASSVPRYLITATYEPQRAPAVVPAPVAPVEPSKRLPEPEIPLDSSAFALPLALIIGAAVVVVLALGWLLLWLLLFRKNAQLVKEEDGRREVLIKKRLHVVDEVADFEVPDQIELYGRAQYSIELKPRLATQEGELLVIWRERIVAREPLGPCIVLNLADIDSISMLSIVTEEVLGELGMEAGL
jgi:hypothetical protein